MNARVRHSLKCSVSSLPRGGRCTFQKRGQRINTTPRVCQGATPESGSQTPALSPEERRRNLQYTQKIFRLYLPISVKTC
jgi:hypothetical protein